MRNAIAYWLGVKAAKCAHLEVQRSDVDFSLRAYALIITSHLVARVLFATPSYEEGACAYWYNGART